MEEPSTGQTHTIQGFDPRQLFTKGFNLECVDLIQGGSFREAIGRTVVALLLGATNKKDGNSPFLGVSIILPPATATSLTSESVLEAMISGTKALRGSEPDIEECEFLKRVVRVVSCSTLEVADLAATVVREAPERLVAVAEASKYRDPSIIPPPAFGLLAVRTSEDLWALHVTSLCKQCVFAVKNTGGCALVHVPEVPAERPENVKQLLSVDDCFVTNLNYDNNPEEIVNRRSDVWLSMFLRGHVAEAVKEIDGLQLTEVARLHILAQLFHRAGQENEALNCIEQMLPHRSSLTPTFLVQVSRLAHKAGDDSFARAWLPEDTDSVSEEMWLEEGLKLATHLEDNIQIERFDARLALLYPCSDRLRENRDRRLLLNCREAKQDGEHIYTTAGFTDHHLALLSSVSTPQPDYYQLIEQAGAWGADWQKLAMICCAMHARSIGHSRDAADVASLITTNEQYGRQATQIVMSSVRAMMLKEEISRDELDYYRAPLLAAVRFLAQHPADVAIRSGFSTLLSVEACGDLGIPIVALTMLDIVDEGVKLASSDNEASTSDPDGADHNGAPDENYIKEIMANGLRWLNAQDAVEFGVTVIPAELVGHHPDHIIDFASRIILYIGAQRGEDVDIVYMEKMVLLVCAMCPHATKERDEDLRMMRLLAGHYSMANQFQRARDLTEQILLMGQVNNVRRRLAWLAFADVYHRCRDQVKALVGLSCALATDAPIEKADLWQEVYTAIRILRDLNLFELARKFLPALKELSSDLGLDASTDPRVISTELGLRLMEVKDNEFEKISALMDEVAHGCERAMNDRSQLLPLAVLLGQVVQKADRAGVPVAAQVRKLLVKTLGLVGQQASQMVKTVSSATPSATDVVKVFNRVQRAIYAEDIAGDYAAVGLVARRLLDNGVQGPPTVDDKALAVELLADHTIALPDAPPDMVVDWPASYARTLSQEGLDVAFLAVDSDGELTVTHISRGQSQVVTQPRYEQPFRRRLLAWLEDYPRNYGYIDAAYGNNDFFTTMEKLGVRLPASDALVIVAEPLLQQLTSNLVLVEPEDGGFSYFLGTKTTVGMVPSLTWLSILRASNRSGRQAYKAWISAPDNPEGTGTLDVALARLSGTFEDFGFTVDTGRRLPRDMSDAGLAVVTAHGGLTSEGRYIHSIRDEGILIEAPSALATALAGVEVVILFVCSGGRLDKHPWDNKAVGLPKQLLDKGCRVVIASPWPLDVKVTYRWLEPFLREWEAGSTILQATKKANEAVARALGDGPQYCLAMTVYGDVSLTK